MPTPVFLDMKRAIVGYRLDEAENQWIAELECGHTQHVRHDPPWQVRPWVVTDEGRRSFLGVLLECPYCDGSPSPHSPRAER